MTPEVILGKDVYIEFIKGEGYLPFGCADNIEYSQTTEYVEGKTLGDGIWSTPLGQSNSYQLSITGLIAIDEVNYMRPIDLMEYQRQMIPVEFRMIFEDRNGGEVHQIRGLALIIDGQLTGPADFGGASFTMKGVGEPLFGAPPTCEIEIFDFQLIHVGGFIFKTRVMGQYGGDSPRYDWSLDGSPRTTALSTGWHFQLPGGIGAIGSHTLEIWPFCENGIEGMKYTHEFVFPVPLPEPESCDAVIHSVEISQEQAGQRLITILDQTNAAKYSWNYWANGISVASGESSSTSWEVTDHGLGQIFITPICSNDLLSAPVELELTTGQSNLCFAKIQTVTTLIDGSDREVTIEAVDNGTPVDYWWAFYPNDPNDTNSYSGTATGGTLPVTFTIPVTTAGVLRLIPRCTTTRRGAAFYLNIQ